MYETATQLVFGEGNGRSPIVFVGEAPGRQEDYEGRPFVGPAGQLFDTILERLGINRHDVYITNAVKLRPPRNRTPTVEEIKRHSPLLQKEIEIINPRVIVALGATAARSMSDSVVRITQDRGKWINYNNIPVMLTYHPAYVLHAELQKTQDEVATIKWNIWNDITEALKKAGLK